MKRSRTTTVSAIVATAMAGLAACAPAIPSRYAQECLRLVRETPAGESLHTAGRPSWNGDPDDGRGPIAFEFGQLGGQREIEYDYISHYIDLADISVPVYDTDTRMVEYGKRWRAACSVRNNEVVLDGVEETGEWQGGL